MRFGAITAQAAAGGDENVTEADPPHRARRFDGDAGGGDSVLAIPDEGVEDARVRREHHCSNTVPSSDMVPHIRNISDARVIVRNSCSGVKQTDENVRTASTIVGEMATMRE